MRNKSKNPTEAQTLKAVCDFLDAKGILYIRHHPISPVQRDGKMGWRKVRPSQVGAPDIFIFMDGTTMLDRISHIGIMAIEVKSPIGKQSSNQIAWQKKFEAIGGRYLVIRNVDELIKELGGI